VNYEWDEPKAASNLDKHGVSFPEAATVFADPLYIDFYDPDHSVNEQRYLLWDNRRQVDC
jgi:uncharacterized DUF497 family protein